MILFIHCQKWSFKFLEELYPFIGIPKASRTYIFFFMKETETIAILKFLLNKKIDWTLIEIHHWKFWRGEVGCCGLSCQKVFRKSKSSDDENMMLHAVLKKSRSHVKSRIEIATLREDTDPDIGVHGEARM